MHLDPATFFAMFFLMAVLNGGLLILGWFQNRSVTALAYWAGAHLTAAIAMIAFAAGVANPVFAGIGLLVMSLHFSLNLRGVLVFEQRNWPVVCAMFPLLLVGAAMLATGGLLPAMGIAMCVSGSLACWVIAFLIWRDEAGALRWSMALIMLFHGGMLALSGSDPVEGHSDLWVLLFVVDIMCYGSGSALLCVALSKDRAERELRKAATTDAMTELFNRGAFVSRVEASLRELGRRGAAAAMLLFDLDLFKSINDSHGHLAGDHVLRRFAAILRAELPTDTLAGRLGGEEFAVFLPKFTAAEATALAERIRAALAHADVVFAGASIAATVSCGVCAETATSHQFDSILGSADDALYRAKARGRNRVELNIKATDPLSPTATSPGAATHVRTVFRSVAET
jgi:diguanylate cyclase (GGDEF)-like protein